MSSLLWKEYRQNRKMLVAVAVFLCVPYGIAMAVGTVARMRTPTESGATGGPVGWSSLLEIASNFSLAILVVGCAFIAGNLFAGERADRSAEFMAYLPVSRRRAIVAKALFCGIAIVTAALVNLAVALLSIGLGSDLPLDKMIVVVGVGATVAILILGTAWLVSTLVNTPAIAAASGIASAVFLYTIIGTIDYSRGYSQRSPELWYCFLFLSLLFGMGSFIAGVLYYLRRVEP